MVNNNITIYKSQNQYLDMQNCSKNEQGNFSICYQCESSNATFLHLFSLRSLFGIFKSGFFKFRVGKHFQGFF